jgi:uncharacterized protein YerC
MIPVEKEQRVRELLKLGRPDSEITKDTGLGRCTVSRIRAACDLSESVDPITRDEICMLIRDGYPAGAIESKTGVTRAAVTAIRRYYYLRKFNADGDEPRECPACGAYVFPPSCIPERIDSFLPDHVSREAVAAMHGVVVDLLELYNLHLIGNVAFCLLADRANEVLRKIGEKNGEEANEGERTR